MIGVCQERYKFMAEDVYECSKKIQHRISTLKCRELKSFGGNSSIEKGLKITGGIFRLAIILRLMKTSCFRHGMFIKGNLQDLFLA